jgi:uncharacterized protein YjbI with pentapeptide repeats
MTDGARAIQFTSDGKMISILKGKKLYRTDVLALIGEAKKRNLVVNLSGAVLRGMDLSGLNFARGNISNADLSGSDLSKSNFFNADLSNSNLFNTNLTGVNLSFANLSNSKRDGANLSSANLFKASL